jgi:aspartate aminotransferase-like enzyme
MKQYIFTPGPTPMSKETLLLGKKQVPYFRNKYFSNIVLESKRLLLKLANAPKNSEVIFLTASGSGAMEATVINLFDSNDNVMVINSGGFGERFVKICEIHKIPHKNIKIKHNQKIDFKNLKTIKADGFLINAHETTTGRFFDMKKIGKFCKKNNLLNIVDAISCFTTDKIDMKKHHIDALIISSNKGLALPPGLAMVILSPKALARIKNSNTLYFNFKDYIDNIQRGQTPFTPAISVMIQLHAKLKHLDKIGIKKQIRKAKKLSKYFRKKISVLGYEFYTKNMPNAMTALKVPKNQDALKIIDDFEKKYNIILTPSGGKLKHKLIRVSHLGEMDKKYIDILIKRLKHYHKKSK